MKQNGGSNQSQRIIKRKEFFASTEVLLRLLMSEIEVRGGKNKSKSETDEKKFFFFISN